MAEMKYILDDLDYYSEVYQTYIRCSGRPGSIQEWVDTAFKEEVVQKLSKKCQSADPLKVLGIGSGAGKGLFCFDLTFAPTTINCFGIFHRNYRIRVSITVGFQVKFKHRFTVGYSVGSRVGGRNSAIV